MDNFANHWDSMNVGLMKRIAADGGYIGYQCLRSRICVKETFMINGDLKHIWRIDIDNITKIFPKMNNLAIFELGMISPLLMEHIFEFSNSNRNKEKSKKSQLKLIELMLSKDPRKATNMADMVRKYKDRFDNIKYVWDRILKTNKIVIKL